MGVFPVLFQLRSVLFISKNLIAWDFRGRRCIEQGILREFLLRNKAEVKHVNIYEYDEEVSHRALREYAYEEGEKNGEKIGEKIGEAKGRISSIILLLEDIAPVPSKLREEIMAQTDEDTLKKWLLAAARAKSIDEFIQEK